MSGKRGKKKQRKRTQQTDTSLAAQGGRRASSGQVSSNAPSVLLDPTSARQPLWAVLAVAWLFCYGFYFFTFTLPNSHPAVSRLVVWVQLPQILLANVTGEGGGVPSGWSFFPQRFDLLAVALWELAGAWAVGRLLLRMLLPRLNGQEPERTVFAFALGLSALSLTTLACGLAGRLDRWLLGGLMSGAVLAELALCGWNRRAQGAESRSKASLNKEPKDTRERRAGATVAGERWWVTELVTERPGRLVRTLLVVTAGLFVLAMLLGALLPPTDFDVKEYHLQGPKEFFLLGGITFLPHNVYTSFPFHTEMLSLLAMVLRNDWFRGALAGKAVLMSFAPLTALAIFAAGRRWFNEWAGWLGAFVYLTTPWTYRLSIIAYVEGGLSFYLFASVLAAGLALERLWQSKDAKRETVLTGLLAGSAMACKYPGVVQVVFPVGAVLCGAAVWAHVRAASPNTASKDTTPWRAFGTTALWFSLGTLVTIGPWLLKNLIETGNPVYPLLYSVFGGRDWGPALDARWKAAHSPHTYALSALGRNFIDVTLKSDWLSPLLFGLAPLALFGSVGRSRVRWLWLYVVYLFAAWWLLTHRIDRFWVPLIPVVALLAGVGFSWTRQPAWRLGAALFIALSAVFNLGFITTPLCGNNMYLADLHVARDIAETTEMGIRFLNRMHLSPQDKVLCVGAAQVFDARFPLVYNTVFDYSIFQQWCASPDAPPGTPDRDLPMRPADEIRRIFQQNGITWVYVNWREILRYRPTYGYTDFVTPERFLWLQQHGVLGQPVPMPEAGIGNPESLSRDERRELETWGKALLTTVNGQPAFFAAQVFPVLPKPNTP